MTGRIQSADIKTVAELVANGATKSSLPQDSQVYASAIGDYTLAEAIAAGLINDFPPLRLYASTTPDAKLNISPSAIPLANGGARSLPPFASALGSYPQTSINFQTGAITGGVVVGTIPSTTSGEFRRVGFTYGSDNKVYMVWSASAASVGALAGAQTLVVAGGVSLGYVDLEGTGTTTYKTAGSATNVIENAVSGTARIVCFLASVDSQVAAYFGQMRLSAHASDASRVKLSGADVTLFDGTVLGQVIKNSVINFTGAVIDFTGANSGNIYNAAEDTVIGTFSPVTPALTKYRWYSVALLPGAKGSDNRSTVSVSIQVGLTDGDSPDLAPRASYSTSALARGQFCVQNVGGTVTLAQVFQLGSGAGGGGGSGSGVGGIDYVENIDAETDVTLWQTYNDAAAAPTAGLGGTVDGGFLLSREATSPLRGAGSFKLVKPASAVLGHGVSTDLLAFDNVDANSSIITVSFEWADDGNYNSTMAVFLYDKTGAALKPVVGNGIIKPGKGKKTFQFYSSASSTSYRLCLHVYTATTVAYTTYFDNVVVGPADQNRNITDTFYNNSHGFAVGDVVSYTSGAWSKGAANVGNKNLALVIDVVDSSNFVGLMFGRFSLPVNLAIGQYFLSDNPGAVTTNTTMTTIVPTLCVDYTDGVGTCSGIFNPSYPRAETEEGDLSFRPRSISGSVVYLRGGAIRLSNGDVLVSGAGATETTVKVPFNIDLATVYGGVVPAGTFWLYIDRQNIGTVQTLDSGRKVYNVSQASNFKLLSTSPDAINPQRYVEIGYVKSSGGGAFTLFGWTPSRYHDQLSDFFSTPEIYKNTSINSGTVTDLSHALTGTPQFVQLYFWDNSASERQPLDSSSFVRKATSTTITIDSNGFTFDAGDYIEVVATYIPVQGTQIASMSTQFESGWFVDTATTTLAHNRTDMEDLRGIVVQEWDTTTGQRRLIPTESLVTGFDNTNLYLDWAGFTPSATLKYRITTSGNALPQAVPYVMGGFTKYVGMGAGSYATLALALAAATPGDAILVGKSETITAALTASVSDVKVEWMPGVKMTINGAVNGIALSGSRCRLVNPWFEGSYTGTIPAAIAITGDDNSVESAKVTANAAGTTITTAYSVAGSRNWVNGTKRAIAGTITNAVVDSGTDTDLFGERIIMKRLITAALLLSSTALAAPAVSTKPERMTISTEYLQTVVNVVGTSPYNQVGEFLNKIQQDARPANKDGSQVTISKAIYDNIMQALSSKKQDVLIRLLMEAIEKEAKNEK